MKKIKIFNLKLPLVETILISMVIAGLLALGNWQLYRLEEKRNLLNSISYWIAHDPIKITETEMIDDSKVSHKDGIQLFSKIELHGKFLDKNIFLYGKRSGAPEKDGYYILSPFEINDEKNHNLKSSLDSDFNKDDSANNTLNNNRKTILIMRGWIAHSVKTKIDQGEISIPHSSDETIIGIVMPPENRQFFLPENDLEKNIWFYITPSDYTQDVQDTTQSDDQNIGHQKISSAYINNFYLRQINSSNLPKEASSLDAMSLIHIRNDHMEYAITWYILATLTFLGFLFYCKKSGKFK